MEQNKYIPGDWVIDKMDLLPGYVQIKQISETFGKETLILKSGWAVYSNDVEPIPLTFEILKKIGWELREHHKREYYEDVEWYEFLNRPVTYISLRFYPEEEAFSPFLYREEISEKPIQYVHQLQHLLFGLGLDSNFDLTDTKEGGEK